MESDVSTRIRGTTIIIEHDVEVFKDEDVIDFGGVSLVRVRILRDTPSFLWRYEGSHTWLIGNKLDSQLRR